MKKGLLYHVIRAVSYLYIISVLVMWLVDSYSAGHTNWLIMGILAVVSIFLFIRNSWADLGIGALLLPLSLYMLLAVSSDLRNQLDHSKPVSNPLVYFGFGYGIFGLTTVAAVTLVSSRYLKGRWVTTTPSA